MEVLKMKKENKLYYLKHKTQNHYLKQRTSGHIDMVVDIKKATKFDKFDANEILETWSDLYKVVEVNKIELKDLRPGDIINYDIKLQNGSLKNVSESVLQVTKEGLKLERLGVTWYCSKEFFNQLLNVSIIESD